MFRIRVLIVGVAVLCLPNAASADTLDVRGEDPGPFADIVPDYVDDHAVKVRIDPLVNGAVVSRKTTLKVYTLNLLFDPQSARALPSEYGSFAEVGDGGDPFRRDGVGHLHLYATYLDDGELFHETNVFIGAGGWRELQPGGTGLTGLLEHDVEFTKNGQWLITAEAQYDDHLTRTRPHPQNWGATDAVIVTVTPEPSAMALLGAGLACLFARRRPRTA